MIKVLLVDDQTLFIESLKMVIESDTDDIIVIGIAYNGEEALEFLKTEKPDVVLMDVRMPVMDGVEATRIIHEKYPDIKTLVLTTFDDDVYVKKALDNGAVGYLLKDISPHELSSSIRSISAGAVMMSPKIAKKLINRAYPETSQSIPIQVDAGSEFILDDLRKRELEILKLMAQGLGNKQISEQLFIADSTVRNQISVIYSKLDVHNRYDAIQKAIRANLI